MPTEVRLEQSIQPIQLTLTENATFSSGGGGGSDANYVHVQSSASDAWVVSHNLNKYCSVTVVDDNDDVVIGEINYTSINEVVLTFTAAFTGRAFFN
jgi:hypothetical protein